MIIAAIGRMKRGPEQELVSRFAERAQQMARSSGISSVDVLEIAESRAGDAATRKREEAAALTSRLPARCAIYCLDERAKALTSRQFAESIQHHCDNARDLALVIGGADGLDPALLKECTGLLGFGRFTLPHQLVRVLVAEQLYRALTINAGHPYHRE